MTIESEQNPEDGNIELVTDPIADWSAAIGDAITKATEMVEKVAAAVEPYPSSEEIQQWGDLIDQGWHRTPPLAIFRALEKQDPNLRWRIETGHIMNLLDMAIEKLEGLGIFPDPENDE